MPPARRGRGRAPFSTRIGEDRIASLTSFLGNISLYLKYGERDVDDLSPDVLVMGHGTKASRDMTWNLSALTAEELGYLKQLLNLAIQLAEPIVEDRDRYTREAFEAGDDSHPRLFRQKPVFVVRPSRRKVERALGAELHNKLVDMMEEYKEHIMLNVNQLKPPVPDDDTDFGGPGEYAGEDADDADINLPLEK